MCVSRVAFERVAFERVRVAFERVACRARACASRVRACRVCRGLRRGGWEGAGSAVRRRGAEGLVTCEDGRVAKELLKAHRLLGAAAQCDSLGCLVNDDPVGSLARVLAHEDHYGA